eukprot:2407996-Pyramimonas_sp.AAC.2
MTDVRRCIDTDIFVAVVVVMIWWEGPPPAILSLEESVLPPILYGTMCPRRPLPRTRERTNGPIRRRKRGYILMTDQSEPYLGLVNEERTDQSDAGCVGIFS